jgi:hypothetical protein
MKQAPDLSPLRSLAGQNAALRSQAAHAHDQLVDAAEAHADRLGRAITAAKPAEVLANPDAAVVYQKQVADRAALLRLSAERHA